MKLQYHNKVACTKIMVLMAVADSWVLAGKVKKRTRGHLVDLFVAFGSSCAIRFRRLERREAKLKKH